MTASIAACASRYSNRLPGTSSALDDTSSRWLARPIRCSSRDEPFGAPIWITQSISPQSTPRSSEAVQTSARIMPDAMAFSTLRRASRDRLPWWTPMARLSSLISQSFWNVYSARNRVLQKTNVIRFLRICSITCGIA